MTGPLSGVRVLDLSRILAGPWSTQTLADLGADVIKVERPGEGDDTRKFGPPWILDRESGKPIDAAYFAGCNRGKRSITVDFTQTEGQALLHRLAEISDIVVENYKVGGLAKYGLDYAKLSAINPRLIYCSITGFGQTGPYRNRPGYDFLIQGMGGLMSITGERDDQPGGGPQKAGVALADIVTGLYATSAILAALHSRHQSGQGQHLDISLFDSQVAVLHNQGMNWLIGGTVPKRSGNGHPNITPYQVFATRDGHIILAVGNDEQFLRFCAVADRADIARDLRFRTIADRNAHRDILLPVLAEVMRSRHSDDWIEALEHNNVPCGPINSIDKVFADPQVRSRGMRLDLPHARAGHVPSIASPMRFSQTPIEYSLAPPMLGEHTGEVLADLLDIGAEEAAKLRAQGTI
ncbi:CaiB/BaiF CoA transferase family protein [Paralcaligenes ginsengisoli]